MPIWVSLYSVFSRLVFALLNIPWCRCQVRVCVVYSELAPSRPCDGLSERKTKQGQKKQKKTTLHAGDPWSMNTRTERVSCVRRITNRSSPVVFPVWVVRTLVGHSVAHSPVTYTVTPNNTYYANFRRPFHRSVASSSPCRACLALSRVCPSFSVPWVAARIPAPASYWPQPLFIFFVHPECRGILTALPYRVIGSVRSCSKCCVFEKKGDNARLKHRDKIQGSPLRPSLCRHACPKTSHPNIKHTILPLMLAIVQTSHPAVLCALPRLLSSVVSGVVVAYGIILIGRQSGRASEG